MIGSIEKLRIVPVVAINNSSKAHDLAAALLEGGLPIAEITLRTPTSFEALEIVANNSALLTGVGSLQNGEQLRKAFDLGARFAVSAGYSSEVALVARDLDIPYFPGVCTPTEMLHAINDGITTLKFFPAETMGGVNALKAMSAPFPGISFMPTGGISIANVKDYLDLSNVVAVGGSWMVPQKLVDFGDFESVISLTREAVKVCSQ